MPLGCGEWLVYIAPSITATCCSFVQTDGKDGGLYAEGKMGLLACGAVNAHVALLVAVASKCLCNKAELILMRFCIGIRQCI